MRTKSRRGGRSKPSRPSSASTATSTPPSMASPSVPCRDALNAEDNTREQTSRKETHDALDEVDCFRKDTCIRCDESGDLLVCTEIGCPIALHEHCMSCEPTFDKEGHFYCPYCAYKRALVRVNELRRKAMVAKRTLSDFIDSRMVSGGNSQQMGEAGKKKASDVSTCGVDTNLPNHVSHLGTESLRYQAVQVEQNQSNEGEDHEKTAGDAQSTVGVNGENYDNPVVSNVNNNIHSTPEVQPLEDSMNEEETREPDTSGTHQVESLEDREDGKMMEEENLRSTDDTQNEGIVKDQGQPEASSAPHDEDETVVDDVDHGAEREPQDKGEGGEQIQPDREGKGMLENMNVASGNNDLNNETIVKKKRFKTRAHRRIDLQNFNSPRKSSRIRTPERGKKSPRIQSPEPWKNHAAKIEKLSASRSLMRQQASPNQFKRLNFHGGKRKRLLWSPEEEEMLKEGVQKFASTANKNLPWTKILEFGRHVFNETRTPVDLKDKWRNILAKVS